MERQEPNWQCSSNGLDLRRLKILYISFTGRQSRPYLDPSTRYRCFYPVDAFRAMGHIAFVTSQDVIKSIKPSSFDIIVVHRPAYTKELVEFMRLAREEDVFCMADYDDLIFNPQYAFSSSMYKVNLDPTAVADTFRRNTDGLRLFEHFSVSTAYLSEKLLEVSPFAKIMLMPNSIPESLQDFIKARVFQNVDARDTIGYFPGTKTHDVDFAMTSDALLEFCSRHNIPMTIVGPLNLPSEFDSVRVIKRDIVPFEDMFSIMAQCRVVIAPLEESIFNNCKSHIKLLEAALACTPAVYTNSPDMRQHNSAAPYFVEPDQPWGEKLELAWNNFNPVSQLALQQYFFKEFSQRRFCSLLLDFRMQCRDRVG